MKPFHIIFLVASVILAGCRQAAPPPTVTWIAPTTVPTLTPVPFATPALTVRETEIIIKSGDIFCYKNSIEPLRRFQITNNVGTSILSMRFSGSFVQMKSDPSFSDPHYLIVVEPSQVVAVPDLTLFWVEILPNGRLKISDTNPTLTAGDCNNTPPGQES